LPDINQLGLDLRPLLHLAQNEVGDVFALSSLARRAENDRDKKRALCFSGHDC
jgi:hypothetical protein